MLRRLFSWFHWPSRVALKYILYGAFLGFYLPILSRAILQRHRRRKKQGALSRKDGILPGVVGLIGNTPLIRINSLSDALGVEILGKAEYLNPGGSVKDRVALQIIEDAEQGGLLRPHTGSRIFEGTVGSTGISIATIARARGYDATIIIPDDVAEEKVKALLALGADVERVRPASIVDKQQFVNLARQRAAQFGQSSFEKKTGENDNFHPPHLHTAPLSSMLVSASDISNGLRGPAAQGESTDLLSLPRGFFADQFENRSNFDAHFHGTGPEIWCQTKGRIDAFVSGAGTGGTISGVGQYMKSKKKDVIIALCDPEGSGLYNKVKHNVMYDSKESEGTKRRHQVDTVVEGIGINRITNNIKLGLPIIDDSFRITDAEAVSMSRYLVKHDGLFLGSSSACNLVACIKLVKQMAWKQGQVIVTILCDSGTRHYSKFWYQNLVDCLFMFDILVRNDDYLSNAKIPVDVHIVENLIAS